MSEQEDLETLQTRQRKELKELQASIQSIKKAAPKGDKKAKKRSTEEIALLQKQVDDRHAQELLDFNNRANNQSTSDEIPKIEDLTISENNNKHTQPKLSKAAKRREAKAAAEQQKMEEISQLECNADKTVRSQEHVKLTQLISAEDMCVYEIPADGNCMFYAVQHQLQHRGIQHTVPELRNIASTHMLHNQAEFLPYMAMSEDEFVKYCAGIKENGVWGGMYESHALSSALRTVIKIVQADVPPIVFGEQFGSDPIVLLYYKHKYGLGEHYDSVSKK